MTVKISRQEIIDHIRNKLTGNLGDLSQFGIEEHQVIQEVEEMIKEELRKQEFTQDEIEEIKETLTQIPEYITARITALYWAGKDITDALKEGHVDAAIDYIATAFGKEALQEYIFDKKGKPRHAETFLTEITESAINTILYHKVEEALTELADNLDEIIANKYKNNLKSTMIEP